jgi:ER lumen protein retaining receptor
MEISLFQLAADWLHVLAVITLLLKVLKSKSCAGISGKTQILYTLVFSTRYLDLFVTYISLYNTFMKILFLCVSYGMVCLIYIIYSESYDRNRDSFFILLLILPAVLLAPMFNNEFSLIEVLYSFSIILEAVAIWPQFFMISKVRQVNIIVFFYLLLLGSYRAFYILKWIYYYQTLGYINTVTFVPGIVQVIPYLVFLGLCLCKVVVITRTDVPSESKICHEVPEKEVFIIQLTQESLKPLHKIDVVPGVHTAPQA